jgi:VPDSG-CTERM motif
MTLPAQSLRTVNQLPVFMIAGFTFTTFDVLITGADSGRWVTGYVNVTGNGFVQGRDTVYWRFIAPPYDIGNFHQDVTGPITLNVVWERFHVPDAGYTAALFGIALLGVAAARHIRRSG